MKKIDIKKLVLLSVFSALFVVFELFTPAIGAYKISISALIIIVIAIMYGLVDSVIVAFIGGFISQVILYPLSPTTFLWMIPAIIRAIYVSIFLKGYDFKSYKLKYILVIISSSILITFINMGVLAVDALINGYYSDNLIFGTLVYRLLLGVATSIIYLFIIPLIVIPLRKFINKK